MKAFLLGAVLFALFVGTSVSAVQTPKEKPAELAAKDAQDFVYLGPTRPVLYRLHVQVEGRPLQAVWLNAMKRIFRYLDTDKDGSISKSEAGRLPPPQLMFNSFFFGEVGTTQGNLKPGADGKITLREVAEHYRKSGGPPFQMSYGVNSNVFFDAFGGRGNMAVSADAVNQAIFDLLDTNKDGDLSKRELEKGAELLLAQDTDEDEIITTQELLANISTQERAALVVGKLEDGSATKAAFVPVTAGAADRELAALLLARYGKSRDQKIKREHIGLDKETFQELDRNSDGILDVGELARFADRPADLEVIIRLKVQDQRGRNYAELSADPPVETEAKKPDEPKKEPDPPKKSEDKGPEVKKEPQPTPKSDGKEDTTQQTNDKKAAFDEKKMPRAPSFWELLDSPFQALREPIIELIVRKGRTSPLKVKMERRAISKFGPPGDPNGESVVLELGPATLELNVDLGNRFGMFGGPDGGIPNQVYLMQLNEADKDNNGYLDEAEAKRNPLFMNLFKLMDADGDGMLYEKELVAYLDRMRELQVAAGQSCASMSVTDTGRGMFDLIDTNKDGKLTIRELRAMVESFKSLDKNGDGLISRDELPRKYRLQVRHGPNMAGFEGAAYIEESFGPPIKNDSPRGPIWFRKMDKNADGDVSRREFLGTDAEFRRIDADNDGLISLDEAERFEKALRKGK